jgi:hypothetical protein
MPAAMHRAGRHRLGAGAVCAGLALAPMLVGTARADCFDWNAAGLAVTRGQLPGLPPGTVEWRTARVPIGFGHLATAVELRWTARGAAIRQTIFEAVQDGVPSLSRDGARVLLRVRFCERDGTCRATTLPYVWDAAAGRFAGASPAARESLAAACQGDAEEPPGTD